MTIRPFASIADSLAAHEAMFGDAGRVCADAMIRYATTLFDEPIEPLSLRIIFAPGEMGAYNRHTAYVVDFDGAACILLNRHRCQWSNGALSVTDETVDTIVLRCPTPQ